MKGGWWLVLAAAACADSRPPDGTPCPGGECVRVHPSGIADPSSPDFHGALVAQLGWSFDSCVKCHGADFAGGTSRVSCLGCHASGPTSCTGCHAQPPSSGAHAAHSPRFACATCHVVPAAYTDAGHLKRADGSVIERAQVTFGGLAGAGAAWDGHKCTNVYCHGAAQPTWQGGSAPCGSCHGVPPPTHARAQCAECHPRVTDAAGNVIASALHVDGKVSLGDDSGTCLACHPNPGGAHASHTRAAHRLAPPIACSECHALPQTVTSAGHIDHAGPAIVFPPSSGPIARADSAQPAWSGATCAGVYCHGGGAKLAGDASPGIVRTPSWTPGSGAADCGACHGIPPTTAPHAPSMTLAACTTCHPTTIDATGAFVTGGTHLDGKVDAQ
jgi:predicted CxxxxCH...CXXCH cytochrome family protein